MFIPMPSPNNTNKARLYVPASRFGPVAAYDFKRGLASDGKKFDPEGDLELPDDHPAVSAMRYARARLNSSDCQVLKHLLRKAALSSPKEEDDFEDEPTEDDEGEGGMSNAERSALARKVEAEAQDKKRKLGKDEPPPFPGRPRQGGTTDPLRQAQDAAWEHAKAIDRARKHGVPGLPPSMALLITHKRQPALGVNMA